MRLLVTQRRSSWIGPFGTITFTLTWNRCASLYTELIEYAQAASLVAPYDLSKPC